MGTKTALLLLVFALPVALPGIAATPDSRLVIYVETAAAAAEPTRLALETVTLEAGPRTLPLRPERTVLDTAELAGTQQRLIDQPVEAGHYDRLRIDLADIAIGTDGAAVHPDPPSDGVAVPLDLEIGAGECAFLILQWRPRRPAATGPHRPELVLRDREVPPLGSLAFVANEASASVSVLDQTTGRMVDCIAVGDGPRDLAYSPANDLLYVALAGDDAIAVVEATSCRRLQTVQLRYGDEPSRLLLAADENRLYVLNRGADTVTALSIPGLQEMGRIAVGPGPRSLARDERTGWLYIASETAGEILVHDPAHAATVTSLLVDSTPAELSLDPTARQLHVASGMRSRVVTVDLETGEIVNRTELCATASGLVFAPITRRLYAAAGRCRQLAVIQPTAGMEIRAIDLDAAPGRMALSADRRRLLVTLPDVDRLAVCNLNAASVEIVVETGRRPAAVVTP